VESAERPARGTSIQIASGLFHGEGSPRRFSAEKPDRRSCLQAMLWDGSMRVDVAHQGVCNDISNSRFQHQGIGGARGSDATDFLCLERICIASDSQMLVSDLIA
jgi:hypothetical protein